MAWHDGDTGATFDDFTLFGPNDAPIIGGPLNQTYVSGSAVPVDVPILAIDPEGGVLTYDAIGLPTGITLNALTGMMSGVVTAAVGTYPVTVSAFDGTSASTYSFLWRIIPLPPAPPTLSRVFDTFTTSGSLESIVVHVPDVVPSGATWSVLSARACRRLMAVSFLRGARATLW